MPNLLPEWHFMRPMGRLIWASILLLIGVLIILWQMRKPRSEEPTTWAAAMGGAVFVFGLFLLAYAVIPHEWITFADGYLKWGKDRFLFKSGQSVAGFDLPFSMTYQALRDIVAVGIYVVFFAANIALFVLWQKRPTAAEKAAKAPVEAGRSRFGRPVKAKA